MLLTHSHSSTSIIISESFAKKMQWLNTGTEYETTLGPNLVHSYPNHKRQTIELSNNKPSKIENGWLYLSALSDWRFVNLNQSFRDALNVHPRPLVVAAKLTVNKQTVTQRLGQVHYAPDGLQRYCFTPPQEQFPSNSPTGKLMNSPSRNWMEPWRTFNFIVNVS